MGFSKQAVVRVCRGSLLGLGIASFGVYAGAPSTTSGASAFTCTLGGTASAAPAAVAPATHAEESACLISVSDLARMDGIYDVRSRSEFVAGHIPGATHVTTSALMTMPGMRTKAVAVYDAGKFPADALMLCERLHRAGLVNAKVLDGGIAAWGQAKRHPSRMVWARLSDAEIAAAIGSPTTRVIAASPALEGLIDTAAPMRGPSRTLLLAEPGLSTEELQRTLDREPLTTYYWVGSADQLENLTARHVAQNRKRIAGPGESPVCDSL